MKIAILAGLAGLLLTAAGRATALDDEIIERLAICKESWLEWKTASPAQLDKLGARIRADFTAVEGKPYVVPKARLSILGLGVSQLYPGSVGMGVGFSAMVDAPFDRARRALESKLGKPLTKCESGEGMRSCEMEMGEKRTLMIMATDDAKSSGTLLGCYYYYEK